MSKPTKAHLYGWSARRNPLSVLGFTRPRRGVAFFPLLVTFFTLLPERSLKTVSREKRREAGDGACSARFFRALPPPCEHCRGVWRHCQSGRLHVPRQSCCDHYRRDSR